MGDRRDDLLVDPTLHLVDVPALPSLALLL